MKAATPPIIWTAPEPTVSYTPAGDTTKSLLQAQLLVKLTWDWLCRPTETKRSKRAGLKIKYESYPYLGQITCAKEERASCTCGRGPSCSRTQFAEKRKQWYHQSSPSYTSIQCMTTRQLAKWTYQMCSNSSESARGTPRQSERRHLHIQTCFRHRQGVEAIL